MSLSHLTPRRTAHSLIVVYLSANYCCHLRFNVCHQGPGPVDSRTENTGRRADWLPEAGGAHTSFPAALWELPRYSPIAEAPKTAPQGTQNDLPTLQFCAVPGCTPRQPKRKKLALSTKSIIMMVILKLQKFKLLIMTTDKRQVEEVARIPAPYYCEIHPGLVYKCEDRKILEGLTALLCEQISRHDVVHSSITWPQSVRNI